MSNRGDERRLTSNQKVFLIGCVGAVATMVLGCMTYLVPTCVQLIKDS